MKICTLDINVEINNTRMTMVSMDSTFFSALLVVLLLVSYSSIGLSASKGGTGDDGDDEKEIVVTLGKSNFTKIVSKHKFVVVEFYFPWSGYHKLLAPEYEKAAKILSSHAPPIVLAKVDASKKSNKKLASSYNVGNLEDNPAVKILRKVGKTKTVHDYKGPQKADEIVSYLKKQAGPASVKIKSAKDASAVFSEDNIVVVGIFSEFSGEEYKNFMAIAEKLRSEFDFAHTLDTKLLPGGDSSVKKPLVRLFKPFDELVVDFQDFRVDSLEKFIQESSIPLVTILTKNLGDDPYVSKFFANGDVKVMLLMHMNDRATESYKAKYREIAKSYKGKGMSFLIGDVEVGYGLMRFFGVEQEETPMLSIETLDKKKYVKANVGPEDIVPWLKEFEEGKLVPYKDPNSIPDNRDTKDEL
ncbi:hypothetical protein Droror1_Dr00020986 [Drosera rotundifolia]